MERERERSEKEETRKRNAAWSGQSSRKEERQNRRDKKAKKKQWLKAKATSANEQTTSPKRPRAEEDGEDTWKQLAREERMAKKLKRGEISQKEFDAEFVDL
jgi:ATP-dependent RNA helicase DDX55/SPB4